MAATGSLRRRFHAAGIALLVAGLAAGCDGAPPPAQHAGPPPSAPATGDAVLGPAVDDPRYPGSPREYAELTVAAWAAPDLFRLGELASPQVQQQILDLAGPPDLTWRFLECRAADDQSHCGFYNGDGDQLVVTVSHDLLGDAQAATGVTFEQIRYPAEPLAYVAEFLTAWQAGNRARMAGLASTGAVAAFAPLPRDAPVDYQPGPAGGGAGDGAVEVLVDVAGVEVAVTVAPDRLGGPRAIRSAAPLA